MIKAKVGFLTVLFATAVTAHASEIWQWTHEAHGMGTSNVMDGGPPVMDTGQTTSLSDDRMTFNASDRTMSGSLGAAARARGSSTVDDNFGIDSSFRVSVDLTVGYLPGLPGGDNPGGSAEGETHSVVEFVVPVDDMEWFYRLDIDNTFPFPFTGSSSVLVENLTQSSIVLALDSELETEKRIPFPANAGDVIRLTSDFMGEGGMGPGSSKAYAADIGIVFSVPEPGSLSILFVGLIVVARRHDATYFPTLLTLQRKVASCAGSYLGQVDAVFQ